MGTVHNHLHFAPSSVGSLMDPDYLRQAVHDAEVQLSISDASAAREPSVHWHQTVRRVIADCVHRLVAH